MVARASQTNVSINLAAGASPRVLVSLDIDAQTRAATLTVQQRDGQRPFLDIEHGDTIVSLSTPGGNGITAQDLAAAHRLLAAVAGYVAECERVHAALANTPTEPSPSPDASTSDTQKPGTAAAA